MAARKLPGASPEPALLMIERHPEFSELIEKREQLRSRLEACEGELASMQVALVPAKIYDDQVSELIANPAMNLEDLEARNRRERCGEIGREMGLIRRALGELEGQLAQTRSRLSVDVRKAQAPLYRQDLRKALDAALRLRLIDGQRSARLSRVMGHGYNIGGFPLVQFTSQDWGAVGDCQSHWASVLRGLRDEDVISADEFASITAGAIPDTLTAI